MRAVEFVLYGSLILSCISGCQGGAGNGSADTTEDESNLTSSQSDAIRAAFDSAIALGAVGAGAYPTADDGEFIANFAGAPVDCPTVDFAAVGESRSVSLDYGESCSPRLYPDATIGGEIAGTVNLGTSTVELTLTEFLADDQAIDGTLSASIDRDAPLSTLDVEVALTVSDLGEIEGDALIVLDTSTGAITIPEGTMNAVSASGDAITVEFDMVVIQPIENGNFFPESGAVEFTLNSQDGPPVRIRVEFDENTPVEGSVNYAISALSDE